ncbi:RtcB family protein [Oharaeibacter diazotrophicus]|uniref:3'-phosphate/5'-hydroxy nucleic acid ligase n=1 Tax=Oharaeibacter diazotrophicus TaxID=1920512 RepID=A0A4R6RN07_9HYPH|nr:RtcB family protein [Oharaeibacter diazotrophicus]TDP87186.1 RNA-splicing ligase RtcB [Oharaeibacter diazotrophicus]BBE70871.1 RNA-splicing ligase RtcB [Pleomorphomonas sp. SM30]GLS77620.1 RNA-splicing ligase RtcB [Oharaeibacter diazotrophicus]
MAKVMSGQDLIDAGFRQGRWFGAALAEANRVLEAGGSEADAMAAAGAFAPAPTVPLRPRGELPLHVNIEADGEDERANVAAVVNSMTELLRTPVVRAGAIMPDACPAGPPGTIPVGGVVASTDIHPGMHSADICCSMAISVIPGATPAGLLDAVHAVTHFGPGGRPRGAQIRPPADLMERFAAHPMLADGVSQAIEHFATQGDGNHFAFVGTLRSTGETALVTHHGSRGPGARLYTLGHKLADRHRRELSPETLPDNAWIPADSAEGEAYFAALQLIRGWTKASHFALHDMAAERLGAVVADRFWNEHNFVFRKADGLFYHGKGATPAFAGFADDATDLTLVPLNMAEPVLIVRGRDAPHGLGFSPHGAGRNFSRSRHRRMQAGRPEAEILAEETRGIDARFFCGVPDISELPSAYKNAAAVRAQIERFGLAEVVDEVVPHGCIMAGDWEANAPWRKRRAARLSA